jgi:hypothetical protein
MLTPWRLGAERVREKGLGKKHTIQGHYLSHLLPVTKLDFLKFPPPVNSSLRYEYINGLIR